MSTQLPATLVLPPGARPVLESLLADDPSASHTGLILRALVHFKNTQQGQTFVLPAHADSYYPPETLNAIVAALTHAYDLLRNAGLLPVVSHIWENDRADSTRDEHMSPSMAKLARIVDDAQLHYRHIHISAVEIDPTRVKQHGVRYAYVTKHTTRNTKKPYETKVPVPAALRAQYGWPALAYGGYHPSEKIAAKVGAYIKREFARLLRDAPLRSPDQTRKPDAPTEATLFLHALCAQHPDAEELLTSDAYACLRSVEEFKASAYRLSKELFPGDIEHKRPGRKRDGFTPFSFYRDVNYGVRKPPYLWSVTISVPVLLTKLFGLPPRLYLGSFEQETEAGVYAEAARRILSAKDAECRDFLLRNGIDTRID